MLLVLRLFQGQKVILTRDRHTCALCVHLYWSGKYQMIICWFYKVNFPVIHLIVSFRRDNKSVDFVLLWKPALNLQDSFTKTTFAEWCLSSVLYVSMKTPWLELMLRRSRHVGGLPGLTMFEIRPAPHLLSTLQPPPELSASLSLSPIKTIGAFLCGKHQRQSRFAHSRLAEWLSGNPFNLLSSRIVCPPPSSSPLCGLKVNVT